MEGGGKGGGSGGEGGGSVEGGADRIGGFQTTGHGDNLCLDQDILNNNKVSERVSIYFYTIVNTLRHSN